ncbi:MAG: histidine ammonia-lyase [Thermoplasmatales archaeon]|nr:histidine ammonia-lyase [Thermoplasmatales archaeon]
MKVCIDGKNIGIEDVVNVARNRYKVEISKEAMEKIEQGRKNLLDIIEKGKAVYGINTGFGVLENVKIGKEKIKKLQKNLVRSHSCGVGEPLEEEIVRAIIFLRLQSLAKGYSGVRAEIVEKLAEMLNKNFHPFLPSQGSVGASGDLVPLAHLALSMMGEGLAFLNGRVRKTEDVFKELSIKKVELSAKEGIALINGTQFMSAIACLALHDSINLLKNAQIAGVMSLEALKGTDQAFREEISKLRPYNGQIAVSRNLWKLTRGSEIIASHKDCERVQDAYTLRCMPQVFGAMHEYLSFLRKMLEIEINSVTDNPLIFENFALSGGNFHGEPLAILIDILNILLTKMGNFSERRIFRLLDKNLSGLPAFLIKEPGINSGMMILQYVAASLASENKSMAYPSSVDNIPTSANQEDYQSMGSIGARKCLQIMKNTRKIIAIEYIVASQALDFFELSPSKASKRAKEIVRKYVKELKEDRAMYEDIEKIEKVIQNGEIVREVEKIVGKME